MRRRGIAAALVVVLLAGCASHAPIPDAAIPSGLAQRVELSDTPFFPQADRQCGPAALATVLVAAGVAVTPQQLEHEVYVPGRKGAFQAELVAAIRARGLLAYTVAADPVDVMAQIAAGHPVLILQRQGLGPWPAWHYAVVVGYDRDRSEWLLRSGTTERKGMGASMFDALWSRAGRWAVVAVEPGAWPANPEPARYLEAAAGLEATGRRDDARRAYAAAAQRWPAEPLAPLGLGNVAAATGDWRSAEAAYRQVLALDPGNAAAHNNRAEALSRLGCPTLAHRTLAAGLARVAADDPLRPALERTLAEIQGAASGDRVDSSACAAYAGPP